MSPDCASIVSSIALRAYDVCLLFIGIVLAGGGGYLLGLGGSPYYMLSGIAVTASGVLLLMRRAEGASLYGLVLLATIAWALWEVGFNGWLLLPRICAPVVLGAVLLLPDIRNALVRKSPPWSAVRAMGALAVAIVVGLALRETVPPVINSDPMYRVGTIESPSQNTTTSAAAPDMDWVHYGNDARGSRFSTNSQITPENIQNLELA